MARKVYVELKVRLILFLDDEVFVSEAIQEMDYNFSSTDNLRFQVADSEIVDFEVTDSK